MQNFDSMRKRMVETQLIPRGIKDPRVINAMLKVPRHLFVEEALWNQAYGDHALPIGEGQTISQPYMVAIMTELLELKGAEKVLEIGTGSGYQAAVLAELCAKVCTIERIGALGMRARKVLDFLGYSNVAVRTLDGTYGWRDEAPFDGIIVTAASPDIPRPLFEQLKEGGRMLVPIGDRYLQTLTLVIKKPGGQMITKSSIGCVFVPLLGAYGFKLDGRDNG
ncbi:MAG: protein-L-isoaspartate(D-aspartate) O-methyltransferase [Nitrospirae bacterium]|nr:protein-L-isoaspartate(D-aspartate) O-methyltransferase [Nitrospirota bacterium]